MVNFNGKAPEKKEPTISPSEGRERIIERLYEEKRETLERKEFLEEREKVLKSKLEEEIKKMETSPELIEEAKTRAEEISHLEQTGKLRKLIDLASERGIIFAVRVARNLNDPYVLDIFHDILAREGFCKKFPAKL